MARSVSVRRTGLLVLVLMLITVALPEPNGAQATGRATVPAPADPIETTYLAPGRWTAGVTAVCTRHVGDDPTHVRAGGYRHPVVTRGGGTDADPGLRDHRASWGPRHRCRRRGRPFAGRRRHGHHVGGAASYATAAATSVRGTRPRPESLPLAA
jgi:hypothetical protein